MKVEVARRALREAQRITKRWREHAFADPDLFEREVEAILDELKTSPVVGQVYAHRRGKTIRRVLLEKSLYHLYYRQESEDVVLVMCIWSAQRARGPKL